MTASATQLRENPRFAPAIQILSRTNCELDRVMCASSGELFASQLTHLAFDGEVAALPDHIVCFHVGGSADVEKRVRGLVRGTYPRQGTVSLVPANVETSWRIGGPTKVGHVYVAQSQLDAYCREALELDCRPVLRDFFDVDDPWLRSFFTMLLSESGASLQHDGTVESLLLDATRSMLVRHLVDHYTDVGPAQSAPARRAPNRLGAAVLRRVLDYIDAHLGEEIRLMQLAAIACQSDDHFIRAFRAAVGCTPYQYVLNRRVECAKTLLGDSQLSIADICRRTGFGNPCHFSAAFRRSVGTTPRDFRSERRQRRVAVTPA